MCHIVDWSTGLHPSIWTITVRYPCVQWMHANLWPSTPRLCQSFFTICTSLWFTIHVHCTFLSIRNLNYSVRFQNHLVPHDLTTVPEAWPLTPSHEKLHNIYHAGSSLRFNSNLFENANVWSPNLAILNRSPKYLGKYWDYTEKLNDRTRDN